MYASRVASARLTNGHRLRTARSSDCLDDLGGEAEAHIFGHDLYFFDAIEAVLTQIIDYVFDQDLGSRSARCNRHCVNAFEPCGIDGQRVINQVAQGAEIPRN